MAVEADTDGGGNAVADAKKGGNRRLLLIGGAIGLALIVAGAGGYFFLTSQKASPAATEEAAAIAAPESFIFNLPEITVNLASADGAENYMKLTIALEVADQGMMTIIQPRMAKVMDAFQVYLRELRKSDLDGSAGIYRLKEELLRRVNVAIAPAHVENILFKEILVQ